MMAEEDSFLFGMIPAFGIVAAGVALAFVFGGPAIGGFVLSLSVFAFLLLSLGIGVLREEVLESLDSHAAARAAEQRAHGDRLHRHIPENRPARTIATVTAPAAGENVGAATRGAPVARR